MTIDLDELSDRLAVRAIVDAYAHHVDRREHAATAALFVEDGHLIIYDGQPNGQPPNRERHGREQIERAMHSLDRYVATSHLLGQHVVVLAGDTADGETYCFAQHIAETDDSRTNMVMAIRYLDHFVRTADGWRIETRKLAVDWTETRPMH